MASEAEWEYACRAGTETAYWWGDQFDPARANTHESGLERTTAVGSFPANPWGLYDMLGNVWEWVEDHSHMTYENAPKDGRAWVDGEAGDDRPRVLRGGSWFDKSFIVRCASRNLDNPNERFFVTGFRVVCSSPS